MSDQNEIGVLIAASQPSVRNGLTMLLNEESGLHVVAEAVDSHELLKKIESTCPDMVLLDWELLDRATPILIKTICSLDENLIVITLSAKIDHKQAAIDAGADAFVNICDPPKQLLTEISKLVGKKELDA